jgi:hypothetical protein
MPQITLELGDVSELAEMLTFLAEWLPGSQKLALDESLAAFTGHPACNTCGVPEVCLACELQRCTRVSSRQ